MAYPQPPDGTQPPSSPPAGSQPAGTQTGGAQPEWPPVPDATPIFAPPGYQPPAPFSSPPAPQPFSGPPTPFSGPPTPYSGPPTPFSGLPGQPAPGPYGPYAQPAPYGPAQVVARKPFWTTAKIVSTFVALLLTAVLCGTGAVVSLLAIDANTNQEAGSDPDGDRPDADPGDGSGLQPPRAELPTLGIGLCLSRIEGATDDPTAPVVSCQRPHLGEVFEIIPMSGSAYPGDAAMQGKLGNCTSRLGAYANMSKVAKMTVFVTYPTRERWDAGDSMVYCVVGSRTVTTTGSVSKRL